jgi:hypothetical protein
MANSFITPVWSITDTGSLTTSPVKVRSIYWTGATAGATLVLHDKVSGNIVWQAKSAAGEDCSHPIDCVLPGLYLTTISAGTLLIYV